MLKRKAPLIIGIAGGSGSGKTTVANDILKDVGAHRIVFLQHDSYDQDWSQASSQSNEIHGSPGFFLIPIIGSIVHLHKRQIA